MIVGVVAWRASEAFGPGITIGVMLALAIGAGVAIVIDGRQHDRRVQALIVERAGESICTFARSFDYRRIDTWIIRAVWDEVRAECSSEHGLVPLRRSDPLIKLFGIDGEDLEDMVVAAAERCGRSLDDLPTEGPARIETVGDVVEFLARCPKVRAA